MRFVGRGGFVRWWGGCAGSGEVENFFFFFCRVACVGWHVIGRVGLAGFRGIGILEDLFWDFFGGGGGV